MSNPIRLYASRWVEFLWRQLMLQVQSTARGSRELRLQITFLISVVLLLTSFGCQDQSRIQPTQQVQQDPLLSWNDTAPKKNIIAFVDRVTKEGGPDFVP